MKFALGILSLITLSSLAYGQESAQSNGDPFAFLDKGLKVIQDSADKPAPEWLKPSQDKLDEYEEPLRAIVDKSRETAISRMEQENKPKKWKKEVGTGDKIIVFLTTGKVFDFDAAISFLESFADDKRVYVALAGFPEGCKDIRCAIQTLSKYNNQDAPIPPIKLDPLSFKRFHVNVVPTMVYLREGKEVARVEGLYNPEWLDEKMSDEGAADYGVYGDTVAVTEKNLIDEIEERFAKVDWEAKKKKAVATFWDKQDYLDLPRATQEKEYLYEPLVRATKDIKDKKGNVIVSKGTTVNALAKMKFTSSMIIFNASIKAEKEKAKQLIVQARKKKLRPILISTTLPRKTFGGYETMEKEMGMPVYMLDNKVKNSFHIEKTLTVVESEGLAFVIHEYPTEDEVKE